MALSRRSLKGMGLTDEQVDSIIEMHTETVDALKEKLAAADENAKKLEAVTKERDELKEAGAFKEKYEKEHSDFEAYKKGIADKEVRTAKEMAVKAYFENKSITGGNLDIAMRGASKEIDAVELDGDKIKDTKALDDLVNGTFKGLVVTSQTVGTKTPTPITSSGGKMTREDIFKRDDKGHYLLTTAERQKALAENLQSMRG